MSIQTVAAVAILAGLSVVSQVVPDSDQVARQSGAIVAADYDYEALVTSCSLTLEGDQSVLAATITLPPKREGMKGGMIQKGRERGARAAGMMADVEFSIAPSASGGVPVVVAMAINTKGTGATNGRALPGAAPGRAITQSGVRRTSSEAAAPSCATRPSPRLTLTGSMRTSVRLASCAISDDGSTASIIVPLSSFGETAKPYRGHVTLMKRGEAAAMTQGAEGGSDPAVLAACTSRAGDSGYDLAVAKAA